MKQNAVMFDNQKPNDWIEFEIAVVGQRYLVKLNGQVVNDFTGNRSTSGYIGLEENVEGPVQLRNVRIRDLTSEQSRRCNSTPPLSSEKIIRAIQQGRDERADARTRRTPAP